MIYGIGIDIIKISRIKKIVYRRGNRFANRILSVRESQIYKKHKFPINFLAKRFAAKEAVSKAFGTGFSNGLFFKHIEILHDSYGKPILKFFACAKMLATELALSSFHISLSDDGSYVVAVVIFEK